MMNIKLFHLLKIFLGFIFLLFLSFFTARFFLTRSYEKINDPHNFAQSFKDGVESTKKPKRVCKFYALNCEGMEYSASPFFPSVPLKYIDVFSEKCNKDIKPIYRLTRSVFIRKDSLWGVFWIGVNNCGSNNTEYFGPYKLY